MQISQNFSKESKFLVEDVSLSMLVKALSSKKPGVKSVAKFLMVPFRSLCICALISQKMLISERLLKQ